MNNVLDPRQPAETQLDWNGDAIHATAWVGVLRCTATGAGPWAVYYGDAIVENGNAVAGIVGTSAAETIAMERSRLAAERAVRAIALRLLREAGYDVKVATPSDLCAANAYGQLARHTLEAMYFPGIAVLADEGSYASARAVLDAGRDAICAIHNGDVNAGDIEVYWDSAAHFYTPSDPEDALAQGAPPDVEDLTLQAELLRAELAEVRATLDGEWGRGEGPRPGWVYHNAMWYRGEGSGLERRVARHQWWLLRIPGVNVGPADILAEGRAESNRAAMIAVDAVPSPMDPPSTEDRVTEAEAYHNALWDMS